VATPGVPETLQDLETLKYLRALNKLFEWGVLSNGRIQAIDDEEILLLQEGFAYFKSWYEELFEDGVDPDSTTQTDFLAWQVNEFALYVGVPVTYRNFYAYHELPRSTTDMGFATHHVPGIHRTVQALLKQIPRVLHHTSSYQWECN